MKNYTIKQIDQMAKELQDVNVWIGGLSDEGIIYYYKNIFSQSNLSGFVC